MPKTSKVKSIQGNGTWEGKYGLMYKYEIVMENGDVGEYSSKKYTSPDLIPFKAGSEIEYIFEDGQYHKIKDPVIAGTKKFNSGNNYNDPVKTKK